MASMRSGLVVVVPVVLFMTSVKSKVHPSCSLDNDCGWNSRCDEGMCRCVQSFIEAANKRDCVDTRCLDPQCLFCTDENKCLRCVDFIEEETGQCLSTCDTEYSLVTQGNLVGKVCTKSSGELNLVYVAIIVGICAGILITVLISLVYYFKLRTDREHELRLKLMTRIGKHNEFLSGLTNIGHQSKSGGANVSRPTSPQHCINKMQLVHQVAALRPHTDMFLVMIREAKLKCHSLEDGDSRVLMFKNIINQLSRVLTLLNDQGANIPSDGNYLLDWAYRLLQEYRRRKTDEAIQWSPDKPGSQVEKPPSMCSSPWSDDSDQFDCNLSQNYSHRHKSSPDKHEVDRLASTSGLAKVKGSTGSIATGSITNNAKFTSSMGTWDSDSLPTGSTANMICLADYTEPIEV